MKALKIKIRLLMFGFPLLMGSNIAFHSSGISGRNYWEYILFIPITTLIYFLAMFILKNILKVDFQSKFKQNERKAWYFAIILILIVNLTAIGTKYYIVDQINLENFKSISAKDQTLDKDSTCSQHTSINNLNLCGSWVSEKSQYKEFFDDDNFILNGTLLHFAHVPPSMKFYRKLVLPNNDFTVFEGLLSISPKLYNLISTPITILKSVRSLAVLRESLGFTNESIVMKYENEEFISLLISNSNETFSKKMFLFGSQTQNLEHILYLFNTNDDEIGFESEIKKIVSLVSQK